MTVIILIVIVALILSIGIYVYSTINKEGIVVTDKNEVVKVDIRSDSLSKRARNNLKKSGVYLRKESFLKMKTNPPKLKKVIEMAIADGVLTIDGREQIKQSAISRGYDYVKVIYEVEKHVRFLEIDSDTKLVDLNEKNRYDFERLISHKFCIVLFKIKEWAGGKYNQGEYSENSYSPDILVEFVAFEKNIEFAVKCKWQQRTNKSGIVFSTPEQLNLFREYAKEKKAPVFIVLGLGGKGCAPERLFIVPLKNISNHFMPLSQLSKYEKMVGANFYFDYLKKELK
ncbi:MAG: hypothetical protein ACOH2V_08915 [Candidatus Saccharimonadaceae bacterium]